MRRHRAGQLRDLISIEANTESRDSFGGVTNSWSEHLSTYARINAVSGGERLGGDRITGDRQLEFVCRKDVGSNDISPQMRISYDSRIFDIEQVLEFQERGWFIRIIAAERST